MINVETVTKIQVRNSDVVSVNQDWYCAVDAAESEVDRMVRETPDVVRVDKFVGDEIKKMGLEYNCKVMVKAYMQSLQGKSNYDLYVIA